MLNACSCGRVLSLRPVLFAVLLPLAAFFFSGNVQAQTTIVNYDFLGITAYPVAPLSTAVGITCTGTSSEAFSSGAGTGTTGTAFTANASNLALQMTNSSGANTRYFDFNVGGANLNLYKTFNIYFQATKAGVNSATTVTVQYSLNGGAYTNFASNTLTLSATPGTYFASNMSLPSSVDNPTSTLAFRLLMSGAGGVTGVRLDNFQVQATVTPDAITTGTIATTSYCAGSSISVPFTYVPQIDFPNGTAIFTAELSDASGNFPGTALAPTLTSNASGSQTITATIPSATASSAAYKIRVKSTSPAITGSISATTLTVVNSTTSIAPIATQNINYSVNGVALTVTEGSTPSGRQWYYSTVSGGPYTNAIPAATGASYTPNFAFVGTYYVVCISTYPAPCAAVTSNEVQINVGGGVAPTVNAPTVSGITSTSATLGATVTNAGGYSPIARGTSFKTSSPVAAADNQLAEGGTTDRKSVV